ncbi:flippase [Thioalkalivibrio sp. ALE30]|uniref:flippase n=1 Tax=Thioalkalivibrio sp. ALE30 TaxID=1158181 RepID=UPI0003821FBB|nr:flippase [Thioalkalivibrio sp. ALE30]
MSIRQQLLRGGVGSIAVKIAGTGISFVLVVVLARTLGPEGYGTYAFVMALLTLLAIPAQAGLPQLMVRETAKTEAREQWGLMRGLWRWGNGFVVLFSAVMILIGGLFLWFGEQWLSEARWQTLAVGLLLVPLIALGNVRGAILRGLRRTVVGQLPEAVLRPALLLALVLLVPWFWADFGLSAVSVMALHAAAALGVFVIGSFLLLHVRPQPVASGPEPEYEVAYWRNAAFPLALLAGLQLINQQTDILLLGVIQTDGDVGVYRVVFQVATLVIFGLQALNQVLQPYYARMYAQGEMARLQRLVTYSARVILLIAIPPVIVMIAFGGAFLEWVFGTEYRAGATALAILAAGQVVNAGMGSVGMLLNMTGHERDTVKGIGIAALCNVVLNLVLIPPFGIEGAAAATALTLVIWNLILRAFVKRRLGIETMALARPSGG